ncbi:MAG: AAA family ATPase [Candidatus Dormiibacterota bacterium]
MGSTGFPDTRLVVLRGPSGAGKSSTARGLRERLGRGVALIEQDYLRRVVLREHDLPGAANIDLISETARFALDRGYSVILEGIMSAGRYASMLERLSQDHAGTTSFYVFDVPLPETFRRHATRLKASDFSVDDMRRWYEWPDRLPFVDERVIAESSSLEATLERILREAFGLPTIS